jgi:hypothetical protein
MKFPIQPIGYRYAPMIVEGGAVKVMIYDRMDALLGILEVRALRGGGFVISGDDPGRGKRVRTKVEGISAFDAASKYAAGLLF